MTIKESKKYWENMVNERYFIRGEFDSNTNKQVLASNNGNIFCKNTLYWSFVNDLPYGTYYVDGEMYSEA